MKRLFALLLTSVLTLVPVSAAMPRAAEAAVLHLAMSANRPLPGGTLHVSIASSPLRGLSNGTAVVHFSTGQVTVRLTRVSPHRLAGAVRVPTRARPGTLAVAVRVHTSAGLLLAATRYASIAPPVPASPPGPSPTPRPSATPTASASTGPTAPPDPGSPVVGGCEVFPSDNVWNETVTTRPVAADSTTMIASIGASTHLHPDFGSPADYGIPYTLADRSTPRYKVSFDYADESDPGPYPIPAGVNIEAGSDHHALIVDTDACVLYELFGLAADGSGGWTAGSGAIWDLRSNALRPDGWTSADAAGLPILPGLVRYDEVAAGAVHHAIRFTAVTTRAAHIYPARHDASAQTSTAYPPMGLRVRLKAAYDISGLPVQARVIAQAMKDYGMILADNGSNWYFQGSSDHRFDDNQLDALKAIPGSAFEAVDTAGFVNGP